MKYSFFVTAALVMVCAVPVQTHAFKVLDQEAYRLDAHTALFAITYEFGFLNADLWMPLTAREGNNATDFHLMYTITDSEGRELQTTNAGVVLSDAQLEENGKDTYRYKVEKNDRASFMLIGLATSASQLPPGTTLSVTALPFVIHKDGERTPEAQLADAAVLSDYTATLTQ